MFSVLYFFLAGSTDTNIESIDVTPIFGGFTFLEYSNSQSYHNLNQLPSDLFLVALSEYLKVC